MENHYQDYFDNAKVPNFLLFGHHDRQFPTIFQSVAHLLSWLFQNLLSPCFFSIHIPITFDLCFVTSIISLIFCLLTSNQLFCIIKVFVTRQNNFRPCFCVDLSRSGPEWSSQACSISQSKFKLTVHAIFPRFYIENPRTVHPMHIGGFHCKQ